MSYVEADQMNCHFLSAFYYVATLVNSSPTPLITAQYLCAQCIWLTTVNGQIAAQQLTFFSFCVTLHCTALHRHIYGVLTVQYSSSLSVTSETGADNELLACHVYLYAMDLKPRVSVCVCIRSLAASTSWASLVTASSPVFHKDRHTCACM